MNSDIGRESRRSSFAGRYRTWVTLAVSARLAALRSLIDGRCLEQRLEALRAAGSPTSFVELEANTKPPEGHHNAAGVYERAFAAFVPPAAEANVPLLGRAELPGRGVPWPAPMSKAVADYLVSNRECLSLLREAAGIEDCRYRRDLRELLPNAVGFTRCTLLLRLNTVFQGHQDDSNGVVSSVWSGLRLADSLRRGSVMVTHLVRAAQYEAALEGLEWALSATSFTDEQLRELEGMLAASARTLDLAKVIVGERSYMIETHNDPPELHGPAFHNPLLKLACVRRIGLLDDLDYMADALEASYLPGRQRLAKFRALEEKAEGLSFVHAVVKVIAPLMTRAIEIDLCLHARLTLAKTALAIEHCRLTKGEPPDRLDDLVPVYLKEVPVDPFDGRPIRYRRTQPGYLLYSVAADGQDNGGRERGDTQEGDPCDLCFIVTH